MAVNPPRAGVRPFSGGPLGIGWAPWAIGAAALAVGIFIFMRRGGTAAAAAGPPISPPIGPAASPPPNPFPTGDGTNPGSNPSAKSLSGLPNAVWQFGVPDRNKPYVWRTTATNVPPGVTPGQIFPGSAGDPSITPGSYPGFGGYSWQWAPVPAGYTDLSYAQALSNPSAQQLSNFGGTQLTPGVNLAA